MYVLQHGTNSASLINIIFPYWIQQFVSQIQIVNISFQGHLMLSVSFHVLFSQLLQKTKSLSSSDKSCLFSKRKMLKSSGKTISICHWFRIH